MSLTAPRHPQAHTKPMLNLRILVPTRLTDGVVQILEEDPCVSGLAVVRAEFFKVDESIGC
jgi:hypothetical protein